MQKIHLFILTLIATHLGACGFQLKGQAAAPDRVHAIYLQCDCDDVLAESILGQLQHHHIQLISTPGNGLAVTVSNAGERTFNSAAGDNDQTKEIEMTIGFDVQIMHGDTLAGERRIESSAYVHYDSDTYLGSNTEATETRNRLRHENADKLVRYINSISTRTDL